MLEKPARYQISIPVWGEPYSTLCARYLLPSLLAEGNLPSLNGPDEVLITFCCPPETRALIEGSDIFPDLSALADISFVDISDLLSAKDVKHGTMTQCLYRAFAEPRVQAGYTVLITLNPDTIWSVETLKTINAIMARGKKAVVVPGLRTRLDTFPELAEQYRSDKILSVPGRELSRLAIKNLHPFNDVFVWNREGGKAMIGPMVFYRTEDGSLLQHSFHLHPVALVCPDPMPTTTDTIDGDFMELCGIKPEEFEIMQDGESLVGIEISGEPYDYDKWLQLPTSKVLTHYAMIYIPSEIHWHFFRHRITFASGDTVSECPTLDRIVRWVLVHQKRRHVFRKYPKLDRHVFKRVFRVAAKLSTRQWRGTPRIG